MSDLHKELSELLNRHSAENGSGTPDFLLADYLLDQLEVWDKATRTRDGWWGFTPLIGGLIPAVGDDTEVTT